MEDWRQALWNRGYSDADIQVYIDGNMTCAYCGADGRTSYFVFRHLVLDHVIPKALLGAGETVDRNNRVVACVRCNSLKGAGLPPNVSVDELRQLKTAADRVTEIAKWVGELAETERGDWELFEMGLKACP